MREPLSKLVVWTVTAVFPGLMAAALLEVLQTVAALRTHGILQCPLDRSHPIRNLQDNPTLMAATVAPTLLGEPTVSLALSSTVHSSQSGGAEQESWSSSSDGEDEDEPVFTPVSEEDQVYASKSRSRYNQKRLLFSQFRYTPTEPRQPQEPVFPHTGKTSQHGKGPVKGGH
uniref:Uncharacterized protein n=1 Tax=Oryzias sinensis TaxID=183150 RepID=A0A8C7WSD0_9TELE